MAEKSYRDVLVRVPAGPCSPNARIDHYQTTEISNQTKACLSCHNPVI